MPTASSLINLNPIVLTDTFNTLINRTNQIISDLNPLEVYEVDVGVGSTFDSTGGGLAKYTGISAGNYNGVITLGLNPGPGLGVYTLAGSSYSVVDFAKFDDFGYTLTGGASGSASRVATFDEFIVNDTSDTSSGTRPEGTAKKVAARYMLPPQVDVTSLLINGDLTVNGTFTTLGGNSYIASNNLRIEDKQIEIAYQQAAILSVTGVSGSTFNVALGPTGYYFPAATGLTPTFYGHLQSFTGPVAGPTGTLYFGALFQDPYGPESFGAVGATSYVSMSSTGSPRYLATYQGATSTFLSDVSLDEGGLVLKGAQGDKSILWIYTDNDTGLVYDSWVSNKSFSVDGSTNFIGSRVFRSFGYTGINQSEFIFAAEAGKNSDLYFTETSSLVTPLTFTGGSWKISRETGTKDLVFGYGATGTESASERFRLVVGAAGVTFPGITASSFARQFNADLLDGAHGRTAATAYSIPIADASGRISGDWFNSDSMRQNITQTAHGFTAGDVIRADTSAGTYAKAIATNSQYAEAIGIVSGVADANSFTLTYKGKITGLTGGSMLIESVPFTPGNVYFLSGTTAGKLIGDPDNNVVTKLTPGQVRKPMLLATSPTEGFVLNYLGAKTSTPTDEVYLSGLVPVGSIQAYAGDLSNLPVEWLLCDGDCYRAVDYPDLYAVIGRTYTALITFAVDGTTGVIAGGVLGLGASYTVKIGTTTTTVVSATAGTSTLVVTDSIVAGTYALTALTNDDNENIFFLPDLRTRYVLGGSTGDAQYSSHGLTAYSQASRGGSETVTLNTANLPAHTHTFASSTYSVSGGGTQLAGGGAGTVSSSSVGSGTAFDAHTPYLVTHYVIRAKAGVLATILTGHNHDERYVRYDVTGGVQTAFGASNGTNAANFRENIGVYGVSQTYSSSYISANYYGTAASDARYINSNGDSGISGNYSFFSNPVFTTYDGSQPTGDLTVKGRLNLSIDAQGTTAGVRVRANPSTGIGNTADMDMARFAAISSPSSGRSSTQVEVLGDLIVRANSLTAGGVSTSGNPSDPTPVSLLVNGNAGSVQISSPLASGRNPTLSFATLSSSGTATERNGVISGLTAPTAADQAANKYYVDNSGIQILDSSNRYSYWSYYGSATSVNTSGTYALQPGVYMFNVIANMNSDYGSYVRQAMNLTVSYYGPGAVLTSTTYTVSSGSLSTFPFTFLLVIGDGSNINFSVSSGTNTVAFNMITAVRIR